MPENLHLIIAERNDTPIAASLLVVDPIGSKAYDRYWGAIEHIPCLHFETAYYQAIEYYINNHIQTFESSAQGEYKMATRLLTKDYSNQPITLLILSLLEQSNTSWAGNIKALVPMLMSSLSTVP